MKDTVNRMKDKPQTEGGKNAKHISNKEHNTQKNFVYYPQGTKNSQKSTRK